TPRKGATRGAPPPRTPRKDATRGAPAPSTPLKDDTRGAPPRGPPGRTPPEGLRPRAPPGRTPLGGRVCHGDGAGLSGVEVRGQSQPLASAARRASTRLRVLVLV